MGSRRKKHNRKIKRSTGKVNIGRLKLVLIISAAVIIIAAVLILIMMQTTGAGADPDKMTNMKQEEEGLAFPYELEDGELVVDSIFQFTGLNPDCDNQEGENIAALTVINQSERHLASAEIRAELSDGRELVFEVRDVPAGQSVMVFEKTNQTYELTDVCREITDHAEFTDTEPMMEDSLSIESQGTTVTLTNNTEEDLTDLLLHCHCLIDGSYFGGLTYTYQIESIPAGESVSVEAEDCYLGEAAAVRVSRDSGEE